MKKRIVLALAISSILMGCQSTSSSNGTTMGTDYTSIATAVGSAALQAWAQQSGGTVASLANLLQGQTNVTANQAVGGLGSMLALAQNALSATQKTELSSLIPGMDALQSSGLTNVVNNNSTNDIAFQSLGMDSSMVSTFAPIVIDALKSEGATSSLVNALSGLWK